MKKKKTTYLYLKQLLVVGSIFFASINSVNASNGIDTNVSTIKNNKELPAFISKSKHGVFMMDISSYNLSKELFISKVNEWMDLSQEHQFVLISEEVDELGIKHYKYQHYYNNKKVQFESITLHEKNGVIVSVNGQINRAINVSNFSKASLEVIKQSIKQNIDTEANLQFLNEDEVIISYLDKNELKSAFTTKINVFNPSKLESFDFYIDSNGSIVQKIAKRYDGDVPSTSATFYKGNQQITVDSYNGSYRLKDNARNIHTFNGADIFVDSDLTLPNGFDEEGYLVGYEEILNSTANFTSNQTKQAVEVHWGMKHTYDYYQQVHNRNSFDGNHAMIKNYAGVSSLGLNAGALDGGDQYVGMIYGTGNSTPSGQVINPCVGIDVAGHEYSHLVISRTAELIYQGESGAINESIADVFGTSIEFYSGVDPNWTIGEGIVLNQPGFMRSMANPNIMNKQPDTYLGNFWIDTSLIHYDWGGVHINSGVGNHWFYLLSVGGSGINDNDDAYNVSGIGIDKAEKIVYRALKYYLTPSSGYLDYFEATKLAVADLYGGGLEWEQNIKAWFAVGIGDGNLSNNSIELEGKLSIYPNPINDGYVIIDSKLASDASYELFDISGKKIISNTNLEYGTNKINVDGYQSGVYLVKINSEGNSVTKKIIIK